MSERPPAIATALGTDLRHAWRGLRRRPALLAAAVLTLGLGTGANSAIFSVVNGVLIRPPAVADPGRLVWVTLRAPALARPLNLSYPDYEDLRRRDDLFSGVAAYDALPVALGRGDARAAMAEPGIIRGQVVSGGYFDVLGIRAARGRTLQPEDDRVEGGAPVAVVSHPLWAGRFGGDPALIGRFLTLNAHPFEVVGIGPPGFTGTEVGDAADIWVPLAMHREASPGGERRLAGRDASWLRVVGRLAPGVSRRQAQGALPPVPRDRPPIAGGPPLDLTVALSSFAGALHPVNRGEAVPLFAVLLAVTAVVLLIACANVGNLLLARAVERGREIGVRLALGATRARLVRLLLAEAAIIAALGAGAGMLLAAWGMPLLLAAVGAPADLARVAEPDGRVLAFTIGMAACAAILCGLAPSAGAIRGDPAAALRGDRGDRVMLPSRVQGMLVVSQMALSLLLLLGAGLLLRSLAKAAAVDPGFRAGSAVAVSFDPALQGYSEERRDAFCRDLLDRVGTLPGFQAASFAALLPLSGRVLAMEVAPASGGSASGGPRFGGPPSGGDGSAGFPGGREVTFANAVHPGFFRTLDVPLLRGRDFGPGDRHGAPGVAIVNETLARRFWPGEDPLGRRIDLGEGDLVEVIGVARDGKYDELSEDPRPFLYLAGPQRPGLLSGLTLVVRAAGDPARTLAEVRRIARDLDPDLPLSDATSLDGLVRRRGDRQRGLSTTLACFGALALLLAGVGLHGVVSFTVARRRREIGLRMALGAGRGAVVRLFVGQGMRLALTGVAVGVVPAAILTRFLSSLLFGIRLSDLTTFGAVAILLVGVAALAGYLPARRATRVDPMVALRCE